jgi:hypothetical protein
MSAPTTTHTQSETFAFYNKLICFKHKSCHPTEAQLKFLILTVSVLQTGLIVGEIDPE